MPIVTVYINVQRKPEEIFCFKEKKRKEKKRKEKKGSLVCGNKTIFNRLAFPCVQFDFDVCHSVEDKKERKKLNEVILHLLFFDSKKIDIHLNSSLLINEIINHISSSSCNYDNFFSPHLENNRRIDS